MDMKTLEKYSYMPGSGGGNDEPPKPK